MLRLWKTRFRCQACPLGSPYYLCSILMLYQEHRLGLK
ncbi:MAG: hypothetical protein EOP51_33855 [Sphingobacteriales bacterium]|nr:MAG: hypothetical protein EOP51_33855 [Sphingobacteriales bacterium]